MIFDEFFSRDYLQKCTQDVEIVETTPECLVVPTLSSTLDLYSLQSEGEGLLFDGGDGTPEGIYYVTESGLHLTQGAKLVIHSTEDTIAWNPFTFKVQWRSRQPHNEDGSVDPFEGEILRLPIGNIVVKMTEVGMEIALEADFRYHLGYVQNPEDYHLIAIAYWNEDVFVRIDDHIYVTFRIESE